MAREISKDSLILVTGINGYIGSHVADQLLQAGYRVRGTTRDLEKTKRLKQYWETEYGSSRLEVVVVEDMSYEGAFDEAVKGVAGVAHTASNMTLSPDPSKVIPEVLAGINNIFQSAASEPGIKRFVYTSSSAAAIRPKPNEEFTITTDSWNEEDIDKAWAPAPYEADRAVTVYCASKVEGEKALWNFVKDHKPKFVCNAILPDCNFGKILVKDQPASSSSFIKAIYDGNITDGVRNFPPQWFVDVQDTGRLHVAALIDQTVKNERIFAFSEPFNWNDVLRHLRALRPDHKFVGDFCDDNIRDRSKVQNERAAELLTTLGRPGWTSLKESLKNFLDSQGL